MSSPDYGAVGVQNRTRTLFAQVMWFVAATLAYSRSCLPGPHLGNGVAFVCYISRSAASSGCGSPSAVPLAGIALLLAVGLLLAWGCRPRWSTTPTRTPTRCGKPEVRRPCSCLLRAFGYATRTDLSGIARMASGRYLRSSDSALC